MKRPLILLLLLLASGAVVRANDSARGWCEEGNRPVVTSGLTSTTRVQASHPSCTITVNVHGDGLATIYSDNNLTPLANPFTSQSDGQWQFYAANGRYDVTMSSAGFSQTITYSDILLCDPFIVGSTCNNGGTSQAHNLLSTTHLDTIPFSPPVRGDVITAQNQTSPTGVNPSWSRLPLGTSGQVLLSNGIDALWGSLTAGSNITITNNSGSLSIAAAGGSGCTLPSIDTAVLSEHPAGTCYDSLHWTWNDGAGKQVMLAGDGTNAAPSASVAFLFGTGNSSTGTGLCCGDVYFVRGTSNTTSLGGFLFVDGTSNTLTGASDNYIYGESNTLTSTGRVEVLGSNNILIPVSGGSQSMHEVSVIGDTNTLKANTSNCLKNAEVIGDTNQILNSGTATGASACMQGIFIAGESNILTASATIKEMQNIHIVGSGNTLEDTLASTFEVEILGELNDVDGSLSTLQIVGFKNVAHNVSSQITATVNTTILGSANVVTNTGNTGANSYQGVFGAINTLQNCVGCWIVGENVTNSTNSTLAIGMGGTAAPALIITANGAGDNILRTPHAFSYYPSCAAGTEGSYAAVNDSSTAVSGATITGSGSNHVLGYCNGTSWTVTGGGGGTGITGSLTLGVVPVASGTSSLTNSSITDDGVAPTRAPDGLNTATSGNYDEWLVDTGGVTANKLVCRSSSSKVQICGTSITQGVIGVAQATATSGQTVKVCWAAHCLPISSNATTAGHWLIPSTSIAGDVDDTGSTTQPVATQTFLSESSVGGGSQVATTILAADVAGASGGGKGSIATATTNQMAHYTNGAASALGGIDLPEVKIIPAANCPNATAGSGWSYATSTWTAACRAGTNNLGGALQLIPSTGGAAQFRFEIPADWDSASQPFIRIEYASGANTSGTVIWTVASACTKADGSVTDDPAFNAESAFGTQTMAVANRAWSQTGQFTAITSGNNCVGGGGMIVKLTLSGTAGSAINAYQAVVTTNRLPTVQAN